MEITYLGLLHGPFVDLGLVAGRVPKITQNEHKTRPNPTQNEHEKTCIPVSQSQKIHPNAWRVERRQNSFIFAVPGIALLGESVKKHAKYIQNACKFYAKWARKNMDSDIASAKNTPQRVSFRFFLVFHVLITFWSIAYGALEFRWCFFGDFSTFGRVSLILDWSDPKCNTVLMRSPNMFGIFSMQMLDF